MAEKSNRIAYLDWMRGFACLLMFQTHCYDSWLGGAARQTKFMQFSQLGGTLPAPLFLFLAGISSALVTDRLRQKGVPDNQIARTTILRGAEVFGFGLLFRLQEFLLGWPYAPWTDLLRVDVLNIIGLSLILAAIVSRVATGFSASAPSSPAAAPAPDSRRGAQLRARSVMAAMATAGAIVLLTPPLWTTHRPRWLPWFLESYVNGVHTFDKPQPWLFPLFPWAAFTLAGLAVGYLLLAPWSRRRELPACSAAAAGGVGLIALGLWLDARPSLYAVYDFWHTSPNFFLIRLGVLLVIVLGSYLWCRWGAGQWGFSPLIEMGRCSLLIYWVHIEFVYGRFSILAKSAQTIPSATIGLAIIFTAMTLLAFLRNRTKGRGWRQLASDLSSRAQRFLSGASGLVCSAGIGRRVALAMLRVRGRKLENKFARFRQAHLLACEPFNRRRVGF